MNDQRKQFYTDHKIQGYFLTGLIVLELALVIFLIGHLYSAINGIIEDRLYRIHRVEEAAWLDIINLLAVTMGYFILANVFALYLAHVIWSRYVKSTIVLFSVILNRIIDLNFSELPDSSDCKCHHQVIDMMQQWFQKEQKRNQAIASSVEALSIHDGKLIGQPEKDAIKKILTNYRQLLVGD